MISASKFLVTWLIVVTCLIAISVVAVCQRIEALAQPNGAASKVADGQHDFDFEFGAWNAHLSRLLHPLTGSTTWVRYSGTSVVKKIWNGRANFGELEVDGPAGHVEGLSLRLYSPQSHQWYIRWANSADGELGQPMIGEFKNGRGEFFDQESLNGRAIYVRFIFSDITRNAFRFEQAFSDDGGQTWEVNWIANFERVIAKKTN